MDGNKQQDALLIFSLKCQIILINIRQYNVPNRVEETPHTENTSAKDLTKLVLTVI